jgi:phosphomannomutase
LALIKSISGIRGTIGGKPGENLTPPDIVRFTAAYGLWVKENKGNTVVIGRDGRISGELVQSLVSNTLIALGINVVDLGLSTTPTVELAVKWENADGGIIITASHNPKEWNALKLLNRNGEFVDATDGVFILEKADSGDFAFSGVDKFGTYRKAEDTLRKHIDAVLAYPLVDAEAIRSKQYKVVVDAINSTGALFVPPLQVQR